MKKDLTYICDYMKKLVIPSTPGNFIVSEPFRYGLTNEEHKKGIEAFREFLYDLYDYLAANKDKIDVKTGSRYDINGTWNGCGNINTAYPVFCDLSHILVNLGFNGGLEAGGKNLTVHCNDLQKVICAKSHKYIALENKSNERKSELFCLLSDLGLHFDGLDISENIDLSKNKKIRITSKKNEFFALGLKLISEAAVNIKYNYYLVNSLQGAFLRCDFYPLASAKPKKQIVNIREFINPQSSEIQKWIMEIDSFLVKNGCSISNNIAGYDCEFTYTKRGKKNNKGMVCRFFISIKGVYIMPGINHPEHQDIIPLDNPDNRKRLKNWIESEFIIKAYSTS